MTTTDYIINGVLVLLVLRQMCERRLDLRSLVLPAVLVFVAARNYLHTIPSGGNDLALVGVLASAGIALGFLCAWFTLVRVGDDGVALARAGGMAAFFWIAGIGARMGFAFATAHGLRHAIASFSASHQITGADAWTAALVLMALCEVTARLLTLYARGELASRRALPLAAQG